MRTPSSVAPSSGFGFVDPDSGGLGVECLDRLRGAREELERQRCSRPLGELVIDVGAVQHADEVLGASARTASSRALGQRFVEGRAGLGHAGRPAVSAAEPVRFSTRATCGTSGSGNVNCGRVGVTRRRPRPNPLRQPPWRRRGRGGRRECARRSRARRRSDLDRARSRRDARDRRRPWSTLASRGVVGLGLQHAREQRPRAVLLGLDEHAGLVRELRHAERVVERRLGSERLRRRQLPRPRSSVPATPPRQASARARMRSPGASASLLVQGCVMMSHAAPTAAMAPPATHSSRSP